MTKIIAILNFKGGVGKTTTTCSIGSAFARMGYKTLLLDLDAQSNLTECFGVKATEGNRTIYDAIIEMRGLPIMAESERLHFIPSDVRLSIVESQLAADKKRSLRLHRLLTMVKDKYDYILIDCPPAFGVGSTSALVAADYAIIPMEPTALPLSGMEKMKTFAEKAMRNNKNLSLLGIVFTRYRATRCQKEIISSVHDAYPGLPFETRIRENITIAEAAGAHWDIFEYDSRSNGAKDYQQLAMEIINRIKSK